MNYNKDIKVKFQVKFMHDVLKIPIPVIAAIQGVNRSTAHHRYNSITGEIEVMESTRRLYEGYKRNIGRCRISASLLERL